MNKYEEFVNYFNCLVQNREDLPDTIIEVIEELKLKGESMENKPLFTEIGIQILEYFQKTDKNQVKSSDVAEEMGIPARKISGAIRKLVTDGFVKKLTSTSPILYCLTEKGQEFNVEEYKENK